MSVKLNKSDVFQRLNFASVEDMNIALMELGESLKSQGQNVSDELINSDSYPDISKEALTLLRDHIRSALETQSLPAGNDDGSGNGNGAIAPSSSTDLSNDDVSNVAPGTLSGFRETLKQLGVNYVATAAGYDISDSFFLALDKALAERNEQNLRERIDTYRSEFDSAVESLQRTAEERLQFHETAMGKFNAAANFSDLDEKLAAIRKK